ncbi:MAG TPA: hypothetical protein VGD67_15870 [Pseudonocardiaceae bacterium]
MNWERLREEIREAAAAVAGMLRDLPGDARLGRVDWSAAETGAHLVSLAPRYRELTRGPRPVPPSISAENAAALRAVLDGGGAPLADRLEAEVAALLDELGPDGGRRAWYFTVPHTSAGLGGVMLAELLLHGKDLATAAGRPWTITREQAVAGLSGVLPAMVVVADPARARAAAGTYHLRLRPADDWTIRVGDAVTVERGRPARADLHLSADPLGFLYSGYGFVSPVRAALTGQVIAWGRRPWLAPRIGTLFTET